MLGYANVDVYMPEHVRKSVLVQFETQAIVIVLVCQASRQVPRDFPVSASWLAVECWGYRYGLLFSNQNSDPHTHADSSSIQTQL